LSASGRIAGLGRRALARMGLGRAIPASPGAARHEIMRAHSPVENLAGLLELQNQGPLHLLPASNSWLAVGHAVVEAVLADPSLFSSLPQRPIDAVLLGSDPPRHGQVRRFLAAYFSTDLLAPIVAGSEAVAASLIRPEFDAVGQYAGPISAWAGSRLLGIDPEALGGIARIVQGRHPGRATSQGADPANALRAAALHGRILAEAEGLLDEEEAASLISLLSTASTETTERLIARGILVLLQHEGLRAVLGGRADLMPVFVEELLRLFPPEPNLLRETTCATSLAGVALPCGARIRLSIAAANRDPALFASPNAFLLDRPKRQHFSFGGGAHHCIGAGLGRRIATVALAVLLREAPAFLAAEPLDRLEIDDVGGRLLPRRLPIRSSAAV
jgi:cytochrome P450